ncbi:MAG: hypothetical protein WCI76_02475 [bacterium]
MISEQFIFIGTAVSLIGISLYIKDIFLGNTKPNLVSWFLWMLGPFLGAFFQLKAGAGLSALPVFMAGFGPLLVIIFSLWNKNAYWKITRFDIICGFFSLLALVIYVITHNLGVSIIFAIISDALASMPTIAKSWKFPETETVAPYFTGIFSNILGLLIIKNWIFLIYSFSAYLIVLNITIICCIKRKKIFGILRGI